MNPARTVLQTRCVQVVSVACALLCLAGAAAAQVAVRGRQVYTAGPLGNIARGVVVISAEGKITDVGPQDRVRIPDGYRVLDAEIVTPGLIDAHCTVGLSGLYNQPHDSDQIESSAAIQPELRATDAYNSKDALVEWVRSFGVTTVHTGHAPGEVISGQTAVIKLSGDTVDEAVVLPVAAVAATLGPESFRQGSPGTRGKQISVLRQELIKAQEYLAKRRRPAEPDADAKKSEPPARDLRLEMLAAVLNKEVPLLVTAQRAQDIASALRLKAEFGIDLILDGAAESPLLIDQIKAAGVPVFVHPLMTRAFGEMENASVETPALLDKAGIPVAIQGGYEAYVPKARVVLFEAAIAAANGLSFDRALESVTIRPARVLKVDGRVGSLEVGKDGDVAMFDADPFEYTSHCIGVVINGRVVSQTPR
ncbi:MAG: amidohydrolase [Planctomyces sp.]|nr:amidohydrolase [Planctomyces sp.]MBA4119773.1 amidohydrolase [Isosphaera sp.]